MGWRASDFGVVTSSYFAKWRENEVGTLIVLALIVQGKRARRDEKQERVSGTKPAIETETVKRSENKLDKGNRDC